MKKITAWFLTVMLCVTSFTGCGKNTAGKAAYDKHEINVCLDMHNMENLSWEYRAEDQIWTLSNLPTVAYPEDVRYQSISLSIPEAYVEGIDTTGDGAADVTIESYSAAITGQLVVRGGRVVTSSSGYEYHSGNAPVLIRNTSVYGEATETPEASGLYTSEGYILVQCGNRGTAPEGLVDLKNAILFIRYNILLGNLPGSYNSMVSTGGNLAVLAAATAHSEDYYPAQADAGAIGVFREKNGRYTFKTEAFGNNILTDGVWGCVVCDPIISLYSSELFGALERTMNPDFAYCSEFQRALDEELAFEAANYVNSLNLHYNEIESGLDLNENGQLEEKIQLLLEKDHDHSVGQNGYFGSFMNYYLSQINAAENLPASEKLLEVENMLALSETPLAEADSTRYSSYQELLEQYQTEISDFYKKDTVMSMYQYNPHQYVGKEGLDQPHWVRFVDNPMTSEQPVLSALALSGAWKAARTDAAIRMVWDTTLSKEELERKYIPGIIDEMLSTLGNEIEQVKEGSPNNLILPGMEELNQEKSETIELDAEEQNPDQPAGIQVGIPMADAVRFESLRSSRVPRYDGMDATFYRTIFDPEGENLHYDAYILKVLEEHRDQLEPLFQAAR